MAPVLAHSRGHTAIAHGLGERQSELGNSQGERLVDVRSTRVWGVMSRKYLRGGIMSQKTLVSFTDTKDSNIDLAEVSKNHPILLANLLQGSRSTFSCASYPSFFAFQEGMWDTQISALLNSPTVSAR
jgi:hypothetical protein